MVTDRDRKVIEFIEKFNVATTNIVAELFYPSLRVAQNRLKRLTEDKVLKRDRDHFTNQYLYYLKKPKQLNHCLLLVEFYQKVSKYVDIEYYDKEVTIENLRADGLMIYRYRSKKYIAFIEVQISNIPVDIDKYRKLYLSEKYKKYFPVFPKLIVISNKKMPDNQDFKIIKISEDLNNIQDIIPS
ncbi:hypothetical protein GOQ27_07150 [Clostridium sp. D2Q-11]|uniref:Replication-relaxation n=1 Tax=Anaeromonas frigoriresistens TaxID=2683708 RepID=A0A942UWR3_9FIRM|nr:hypothetical protein [Anaeromonas frigoriresistens]MBS4538234.1 hypothetical protein [Anaeromonas frigoriresistens]